MASCTLALAARLLGLAAAALPGCTPSSTTGSTEWVVDNQTPDTLWAAVRYPLDSVMVTAAQLAERRRLLHADSVDLTRQHGFYRPTLPRLTRHQGRWFWVQNRAWGIVYWYDDDSSPAQGPQVNRTSGVLTYRIPPHRTQTLLNSSAGPDARWPGPPITGLHLRQEAAGRVVLPGLSLRSVFRPQPTGREHDDSPRYRCQLTVGPGLAINE